MNLETYRAKADDALGQVRSVRRVATRFGGSLSIGAVAMMFCAVWFMLRFFRRDDRWAIFALAVVAGGVGWAISWALRQTFSMSIARHEHGLSLHQREGVRSLQWMDFESVRWIPRMFVALVEYRVSRRT